MALSLLDKAAADNALARAGNRPKTAEQEAMEAEAREWELEEEAGRLLELIASTEAEVSEAEAADDQPAANAAKIRLAGLQDQLHIVRQA